MVYLSWLVILFAFFDAENCQELISTHFSKENTMCDVTERIRLGCSTEIPVGRSLLNCCFLCGSDPSCIGASFDDDGQCFHHRECSTHISGCTVEDQNHVYMTKEKLCKHGTWDATNQVCQCLNGCFGERCTRCHARCKDLATSGYPKGSQSVYLNLDSNGVTLVMCFVNPTGYSSVLLAKAEGDEDFNKTWAEYVEGFYYDTNNFWAGLETWHRFTKLGLNKLVLSCWFVSRDKHPNVHRSYREAYLSDASSGYRLTTGHSFNNSVGDNFPPGSYFGDCLGNLQNLPFSTWDVDNDNSTNENCAAVTGSGWWYAGCDNPCNVLGYGLQYLNSKPRHQIFSLLGVDLASISKEMIRFTLRLSDV